MADEDKYDTLASAIIKAHERHILAVLKAALPQGTRIRGSEAPKSDELAALEALATTENELRRLLVEALRDAGDRKQ